MAQLAAHHRSRLLNSAGTKLSRTLTGAIGDGYFKVRIFVPPLAGGAYGTLPVTA